MIIKQSYMGYYQILNEEAARNEYFKYYNKLPKETRDETHNPHKFFEELIILKKREVWHDDGTFTLWEIKEDE